MANEIPLDDFIKQVLGTETSQQTSSTTSTSSSIRNLLNDLVAVNKSILEEMKKSENFVNEVATEVKKLNSSEKKEANPNKKSKDLDRSLNQSKMMKKIFKQLEQEKKSFERANKRPALYGKEKTPSFSSVNQLAVGREDLMAGLTDNLKYSAEQIVRLTDNQRGLLGEILEGVGAQAEYTREVRATLFETAGLTIANKELFHVLEDIENTSVATGFSQEKAQQNLIKYMKAGLKLDGNAAKYRDKLVALTEAQLSTERQLGLEAGELFDTFNHLYQAGRLTEAEIADMGRGMRDIARQTGLTGKNLQQALSAAQPVLESMRKASTLTATAVKNITQGIAAAEKLGVTEQTKTLLDAASSSANLFYNASSQTQALLFSAAATVGKVGDLQKGILTRSRQGVKELANGITNVLKKFGIESIEAIDTLSDSAKMKLNLNLKAAFGLELGELKGVVESLTEAGKGYGDRLVDIEKKLKTNLTLEERTAALEEKRRLQVSQSLEALTVLDKAAVGAKSMDDALSKFGERRKEFEKDLQALGLTGTNKEVIRGALNEAIKGLEAASKKSLGITSDQIEKALSDPVSFRELTSKLSKADQTTATGQKTQLDAISQTNQTLLEIKTEIQKASSGLISAFMSNASVLGTIAASLAIISMGKGGMSLGLLGGRKGKSKKMPGETPEIPIPDSKISTKTGGAVGSFAKSFSSGLIGIIGAGILIFGALKLLKGTRFEIKESEIIESTKQLTVLFTATMFISAQILMFSKMAKSFSALQSVAASSQVSLAKAGIAIGIFSVGIALLGTGLTYLGKAISAMGVTPDEILNTTTLLTSLGLAIAVMTGGITVAALALAGFGAVVTTVIGETLGAVGVALGAGAGYLLAFSVGLLAFGLVLGTIYKTVNSIMSPTEMIECMVVLSAMSLALTGLIYSISLLVGELVSVGAVLTATFPLTLKAAALLAVGALVLPFLMIALGKFINYVGNSIISASNQIENPSDLIDSCYTIAKVLTAIATGITLLVGGALLLSAIGIGSLLALIPAAVIMGAATLGIKALIHGTVFFANEVASDLISASSSLSNPDELIKAGEKVGNFATAAGKVVSGILGIQWEITKLSGGVGLMGLGNSIMKLFGNDPQQAIRSSIDSLFELFAGFVFGLSGAEGRYGIDNEKLNSTIQKLEKYQRSVVMLSGILNKITESLGGVISASTKVTNELNESTKNTPPKKISEAIENSKSMLGIFSDFAKSSKDYSTNLTAKNLNELEKTLGSNRLPKVLTGIFANVQQTINSLKAYRFSNIELKAISEKLKLIGVLLTAVGESAKGIRDVNVAFDEIKNTKMKSGKKPDMSKLDTEIGNFFETILLTTKAIMDVAEKHKDTLNVVKVGKVAALGNNLNAALTSFKGMLDSFKNNILKPIQSFSGTDIADLGFNPNGTNEIVEDWAYKSSVVPNWLVPRNWWTPYIKVVKEGENTYSNVTGGFEVIFANIVKIQEIINKQLNNLYANMPAGEIEKSIEVTNKKLKAISVSFSHMGGFLMEFKSNILPVVQDLGKYSKLFEVGKYTGETGEMANYNDISNTVWRIFETLSFVTRDMNYFFKEMMKEEKPEDQGAKIQNVTKMFTILSSNLKSLGDFLQTVDSNFLSKIKTIKAPEIAELEKPKAEINLAMKNLKIVFFNEEYIKTLEDFAKSIPVLPQINFSNLIKFSEAFSTVTKTLAATFAFLNEPISGDKSTDLNKGQLDKNKKATKTISEQIGDVKNFFLNDFNPLLIEFKKLIDGIKGTTFNEKDFEKVSKTISNYGEIMSSIQGLIVSFGIVGYELTSTSITTGNQVNQKSVTTLEFIKDLLANPQTSEFSKILSQIPNFVQNQIIKPFLSTGGGKINPNKVERVAKILNATSSVIKALAAPPDGLLFNLGMIDEGNIKSATESLQKLNQMGPNLKIFGVEIKNTGKQTNLLAEFIENLIIHVINPLSVLNKVTSPKRIDRTAKIITSVKSIVTDLPSLVSGVNESIEKLTTVDDSNFSMLDNAMANLEIIGAYLPEFVEGLLKHFVYPLSLIRISPKALNKVADRITAIKKITVELPDMIESLNTKFPSLLTNLEGIDANLGKKLNAKGDTFKEVFIGVLSFITRGVIEPLIMSTANPKLLQRAASQIESLANLSSKLGPVFIGFFQSMEELLDYIETKYSTDASEKISSLAQIFDNEFFKGTFVNVSEGTIKNLEKLLKVEKLIDEIKTFDVSAITKIFSDADLNSINADPFENALITLGDQLDRIVDIMEENVNKINQINALGSVKIDTGEISTATNAEVPQNKNIDLFSKNLQMQESSISNNDNLDELTELTSINEEMKENQNQMIQLLSGILKSLNITLPSKSGSPDNPFEKSNEVQEYTGQYGAKLQTGTVNRTAYVKGSNLIASSTGPFA